ncbi:MAG: PQQ-binding-like beta-propeller repeat protein [Candidatus Sumerlaeota bacterium]|nr:PQQ-binding-like beta-propeller repeat protein [Candidatus Sumerlaeota bacterium]
MKNCSVVSFLAASIILISFRAFASNSDWPRFRGADGAGISDAQTIPAKWTDSDYNWKIKLPGVGHSSPVVWGRRIFVTCGETTTALRIVLCLDAASGRTLWRRDYSSKSFRQNGDNSYASATPAADADGVIISWTTPEEVVLLALDNEGHDLWRRGLGPYVGIHGSGVSPIIVNDLVILNNDQEDPAALPAFVYARPDAPKSAGVSFVIAVDRKTGQTRWQLDRRTSQASYITPCVYRPEGGKPEIILAGTSHGVTAVDAATGKISWELAGVFKERCVGSPALGPGGLVIAGEGKGSAGLRFVAVRPGSKDKAATPTLAYEIQQPVPLVPSPLVADGRLYLWLDSGLVICLRAGTGEPIWKEKVGGSFYSSPVCVNNRIYCVSKNGEAVVIAAGDKFELIGRIPLGEKCFATPAIAGGVMYLRTLSQLFSLGGKKP